MINNKAKKYYKEMFSQPPSEVDMTSFAKYILKEFIKDLESSKRTVKWNYDVSEVIFLERLKELKEIYDVTDDEDNTNK